jgi:ADP-heptose:LPS heptosyltransferase
MTAVRKFLVIRFSSIGDIVLTSAVVRCLKSQVPGAEVHFLVKKQFAPVVSSNPHIARVWLYESNFRELIPQLRAENFNHVIDLHKNYRSLYVRSMLMKPSSSFPKLNFRKWLMVNFRINLLPGIHIVDRYFRAVKRLNVVNDGEGLDYFIPKEEEVDLSGMPLSLSNGFIAFVVGGKHTTKILPAEKVLSVCTALHKPVVLLGGETDRQNAEKIAEKAGKHVYNACGEFTINQSASLIRQADTVISNDTGLMHIAAAFRKPLLSVWGNTIPEFGMYPYFPSGLGNLSQIFEVKGLSCRPCSKIGFAECPKKHFRCMMDQDTAFLVKACNDRDTDGIH